MSGADGPRDASTMAPVLETRSVTKIFGGLTALDRVSVGIEPGAIAALIGPNGAGKTTLFNLLTGILPSDEGCVTLAGRDASRAPSHLRVRAGLAPRRAS